jgi:hypothetical protein
MVGFGARHKIEHKGAQPRNIIGRHAAGYTAMERPRGFSRCRTRFRILESVQWPPDTNSDGGLAMKSLSPVNLPGSCTWLRA